MNEGRGVNRLDTIKARAELVAGKPDNCEPTEKEWAALTDGAIHDVPALLAAVEAVLELHEPITDDGNSLRNWLGVYDGKPRDYCNECEVDGYTAVPYPCPTVTAIQSALGEGEK